MSGAGRKSGGGRRTVTADEAELWEHATRSLDRVKAKPRVASVDPLSEPPARAAPPPSRASTMSAGDKPTPAAPPKPRAPAVSKAAKVPPPPLAEFERRKSRQIASGKIEVDARIDLHGLRQRDAHARLRAFLIEAHANGLKTVLVITGKGGEEPPDRLGDLAGDRQRGVLRRNAPDWLREPELRAIVLSFTQAGVRHGGAGALYVQLRRGARRN
jgi:DNA-nicking Smr family endonuclease